jgi:hypothetical protein
MITYRYDIPGQEANGHLSRQPRDHRSTPTSRRAWTTSTTYAYNANSWTTGIAHRNPATFAGFS